MSRIRGVPLWLILSTFLLAVCGESATAQQRPGGRRPTTPAVDAPAAGAERPASPAVEPLRTAVDRPIDIRDIRLELRVDIDKKTAEGTATLQVRGLRPLKHIELDAVDFHVKKVTLAQKSGQPQTVEH